MLCRNRAGAGRGRLGLGGSLRAPGDLLHQLGRQGVGRRQRHDLLELLDGRVGVVLGQIVVSQDEVAVR